jgi:hypothetical protein
MDAPTYSEQRRLLMKRPKHQFLDREAFCRLLISCRRLDRFDDGRANLRGLYDHASGIRYLIEEERLVAAP